MAQDFALKLERFEGLRCSSDKTEELSLGESPEMINFKITKGFKLARREGYKKLFQAEEMIRGIYCARNGSEIRYLAVIGNRLYSSSEGFANISPLEGEVPGEERVTFFSFCGDVYLLTGCGIFKIEGEKVNAIKPYIPLLMISTPPDGSGVIYEEVNLLTRKVRQKFSPDGESMFFYPILNNIKGIDWVKKDGVEVKTTQYTWDDNRCAFSFVGAPEAGVDTLEIQYEIDGEDPASRILGCRFASAFGGASDTRAFLYGNRESAGIRYHSGIVEGKPDFTYFPETAFSLVGTGDAITSIVRHYDRQLIFTESGAYYSYLEYMTGVKDHIVAAFPVLPLNEERGCAPFGQALLVENTPVTLTENGLFSWVSTNIRDERNAKLLSDPIDLLLQKERAEEAVLFNCKKNSELYICIGTHAYVYNYLLKRFYYYILPNIRGFSETEEGVFFYTENGIFSMGGDTDDGERIRAEWKSRELFFSSKEKLKKLFDVTLFASSEDQGKCVIRLIASPGEKIKEREIAFSIPQKSEKKKIKVSLERFLSLRAEVTWEEEPSFHLEGMILKGRRTDSEE